MKVVHLITQMEAGGAQGAAVRMHNRMLKESIDSTIIFMYKKRSAYPNVQKCITILDVEPKNIWNYLELLLRLFWILLGLRKSSLMCYTHYSNIIGAFFGRLLLFRRVVVSHRSLLDCYPRLLIGLDRVFGTLGFYDSIICVSKAVGRQFEGYNQRYKSRVVVIYNGIEQPILAETGKYNWIKSESYINLVSVGRLHEQKNHQVLFRAIQSNKHLRLIIAGDGHLRNDFECYVNENCLEERLIFLGEIPTEEVSEFISKGDIFLFPSITEAFGFALVEAMAIGLPVLASDIEAFREIGFGRLKLISPKSPQDWVDALSDINNRVQLDEMSLLSLSIAKAYTFESMYENYFKELQN